MAERKTWWGLEATRDDAHFMAEGRAQHLAKAGDVYRTSDYRSYLALRDIPWLKDLGEVTSPRAKDADDKGAES